jgi:acyl carrier protein
MTVWLKRASLFFKSRRKYTLITKCAISAAPVGQWLIGATKVGSLDMAAFDSSVRNRILALVKAILVQNAMTAEVHPDTRLVDIGLTSMDMVNLMLSVEAEFDFTIPQAEITPENFQSIKSLELMVSRQLETEKAA